MYIRLNYFLLIFDYVIKFFSQNLLALYRIDTIFYIYLKGLVNERIEIV